jgi:CIC family chloride channel protein
MQKRTSALKEAKEMEEVYGYLPVLLLRETDALAHIKIEEIMTRNIKTVPHDITVSQFLDLVAIYHHIGYPVINENGEPVGWVTLEEASKVEKGKRNETLVGQIARRKLVAAYPEETALDAFKRMSENETGRILVFERANPKKLLGIVTKTDLMHTLTKQY